MVADRFERVVRSLSRPRSRRGIANEGVLDLTDGGTVSENRVSQAAGVQNLGQITVSRDPGRHARSGRGRAAIALGNRARELLRQHWRRRAAAP